MLTSESRGEPEGGGSAESPLGPIGAACRDDRQRSPKGLRGGTQAARPGFRRQAKLAGGRY